MKQLSIVTFEDGSPEKIWKSDNSFDSADESLTNETNLTSESPPPPKVGGGGSTPGAPVVINLYIPWLIVIAFIIILFQLKKQLKIK